MKEKKLAAMAHVFAFNHHFDPRVFDCLVNDLLFKLNMGKVKKTNFKQFKPKLRRAMDKHGSPIKNVSAELIDATFNFQYHTDMPAVITRKALKLGAVDTISTIVTSFMEDVIIQHLASEKEAKEFKQTWMLSTILAAQTPVVKLDEDAWAYLLGLTKEGIALQSVSVTMGRREFDVYVKDTYKADVEISFA